MARAIEILSESAVDSTPILNNLKVSMKRPMQQYVKRNPDEIKQLCENIVEEEVKWVQQVLSKQEKKARKSTLMKVLHQKYKYSDQHPESRAFQLYDKLISKISLDMASSQTGYMLGMVGLSSFNGMDKEDQIKYKTDINRLTASVDKKVIQRLKEQGLSDQKTVMAIILYASRDKSYDSLSSLYRGSVIDACKSEMENQIRKQFRVQVEDIYAKQALALKKKKHLRGNKEKTPDNETKADTALISMEELSELLDPSCEKKSSYSAHYYRKQVKDESRKVKTKGLPEKVSMEGSGVNEFGDVQESPEELSDEILSDDVKEYWKQVLLDDKFQKGSTQFACINFS